jgi:hypothetical protein
MAYTYRNIQFDHIDSAGNVIDNIATFTASTVPTTSIKSFAIGNKIRLSFDILSSGSSDFQNKFLRFNPALFTISNSLAALSFAYETLNPLTSTAQQAQLNIPSIPFLDNIYCEMRKNGAPHDEAFVVFEFYITQDLANYITNLLTADNRRRLISSNKQDFDYTAFRPSVFKTIVRNIGLVCQVFDSGTFLATVQTPTGGKFLNIPVSARWYNTDITGQVTNMRYIRELQITSPSQIAAGLGSLTFATATGTQVNSGTNVLSNYTVSNNQLSISDDNSVTIKLRGDAFIGSGGTNPAITDVRIILIRLDAVTNGSDFVTELSLNDAIIPQTTPGAGQLDGAIWSPSDWFENVPNADDIQIEFVLKGNLLINNGEYHIIVNIHDAVNPDYVTSHISPILIANYSAPIIPTITGKLSTYNKEYLGNEITLSPHQRVKARIDIDKVAYNTALGSLGTFDSTFFGIICKLQNITGVVNQVQSYLPNTLTPPANNQVLTPDMTLVANTSTNLILDCIFRIAEEYANQNTNIVWTLSFNQPNSQGGTQFVQVDFIQKLSVKRFENDQISPELLAVRFYDLDLYLLGIKTEIVEICDKIQIIAEVEKDPTFTGSINLVATIYPATETGDTNNNAIEEEEDWQPLTVQMSQSVSGKLDSVETSFGSDDFATFRINVPQLTTGQRYWVTAIAYEQFPDYCPLGIVAVVTGTTQWSSFGGSGWTWQANATALLNAIIAHPDYVSGAAITVHNITDALNNPIGIQNITGNILTVISIPTALTEFYYNLTVEAIFNSGSGPHLIRHTLFNNLIGRPVLNGGSVGSLLSGYTCQDLGA